MDGKPTEWTYKSTVDKGYGIQDRRGCLIRVIVGVVWGRGIPHDEPRAGHSQPQTTQHITFTIRVFAPKIVSLIIR